MNPYENEDIPSRKLKENEERKNRRRKDIMSYIFTVLLALVIVFLIQRFVMITADVSGKSMEPTLEDGDRLFVSKLSKIERFDIITFPAPNDPSKDYIKRVIGLPGDTVEYKEDTLYINGEAYSEPYLDEYKAKLSNGELLTLDFTLESVTGVKVVPEGELFVMGDNRQVSQDSRSIGFVKQDNIVGEAKLRYWPLSSIEWIKPTGEVEK